MSRSIGYYRARWRTPSRFLRPLGAPVWTYLSPLSALCVITIPLPCGTYVYSLKLTWVISPKGLPRIRIKYFGPELVRNSPTPPRRSQTRDCHDTHYPPNVTTYVYVCAPATLNRYPRISDAGGSDLLCDFVLKPDFRNFPIKATS